MTRNADGPGTAIPGTATTTSATGKGLSQEQRSADSTVPVVFGVLLVAVAGALCDRILVRSCCWCGCAHVHYVQAGGDTTVLERAPRCRPRWRYQIRVTSVLPAAPRLAGQRRRWTA